MCPHHVPIFGELCSSLAPPSSPSAETARDLGLGTVCYSCVVRAPAPRFPRRSPARFCAARRNPSPSATGPFGERLVHARAIRFRLAAHWFAARPSGNAPGPPDTPAFPSSRRPASGPRPFPRCRPSPVPAGRLVRSARPAFACPIRRHSVSVAGLPRDALSPPHPRLISSRSPRSSRRDGACRGPLRHRRAVRRSPVRPPPSSLEPVCLVLLFVRHVPSRP